MAESWLGELQEQNQSLRERVAELKRTLSLYELSDKRCLEIIARFESHIVLEPNPNWEALAKEMSTLLKEAIQ